MKNLDGKKQEAGRQIRAKSQTGSPLSTMFDAGTSLTFHNADALLAAGLRVIEQGETQFDFAALMTVDSSAVATLLAWQRKARSLGKTLLFSSVPANLASLISLYDTAELLLPSSLASTVSTPVPASASTYSDRKSTRLNSSH